MNHSFSSTHILEQIKDHFEGDISMSPVSEVRSRLDFLAQGDPDSDGFIRDYSFHFHGRVIRFRPSGKIGFIDVYQDGAKVQVVVKSDSISEEGFNSFKKELKLGDFVYIHGETFKTKAGEWSVLADYFKILSPTSSLLPDMYHGITDEEAKYRQPYVRMVADPSFIDIIKTRSESVSVLRQMLSEKEYFEVETPVLHPILGGASAKPFVTHHNALNQDFYLRIAPELYLKKLIAGGLSKVYEIGKNFRNEGIDRTHNPEFTSVEFYAAMASYNDHIKFVRDFVSLLVWKKFGSFVLNDMKIVSMREAVLRYSNLPFECKEINSEEDFKTVESYFDDSTINKSFGHKLVYLFENYTEKNLPKFCFVTEFPVEVSPLAKTSDLDSRFANRFEFYWDGIEIANGFDELNDPEEQMKRFADQLTNKEDGVSEIDLDYIKALEFGLPPTAGCGIGIDRLVMKLVNSSSIKDVIIFPTLRKI